jgi:hypothetical protein
MAGSTAKIFCGTLMSKIETKPMVAGFSPPPKNIPQNERQAFAECPQAA